MLARAQQPLAPAHGGFITKRRLVRRGHTILPARVILQRRAREPQWRQVFLGLQIALANQRLGLQIAEGIEIGAQPSQQATLALVGLTQGQRPRWRSVVERYQLFHHLPPALNRNA